MSEGGTGMTPQVSQAELDRLRAIEAAARALRWRSIEQRVSLEGWNTLRGALGLKP